MPLARDTDLAPVSSPGGRRTRTIARRADSAAAAGRTGSATRARRHRAGGPVAGAASPLQTIPARRSARTAAGRTPSGAGGAAGGARREPLDRHVGLEPETVCSNASSTGSGDRRRAGPRAAEPTAPARAIGGWRPAGRRARARWDRPARGTPPRSPRTGPARSRSQKLTSGEYRRARRWYARRICARRACRRPRAPRSSRWPARVTCAGRPLRLSSSRPGPRTRRPRPRPSAPAACPRRPVAARPAPAAGLGLGLAVHDLGQLVRRLGQGLLARLIRSRSSRLERLAHLLDGLLDRLLVGRRHLVAVLAAACARSCTPASRPGSGPRSPPVPRRPRPRGPRPPSPSARSRPWSGPRRP